MQTTTQQSRREPERLLRLHALFGHALVMVAALVLAIMPWSEHYCTFDGFLHGKPDFELSLLSVIVMLCLVLLLAATAKRGVSLLMTLRSWVSRVLQRAGLMSCQAMRQRERVSGPGMGDAGACPLPLRI